MHILRSYCTADERTGEDKLLNLSWMRPLFSGVYSKDTRKHSTMCKIANFAGQMGGHNLNKVDGFLASRDYV